jgi:hypothetical protein
VLNVTIGKPILGAFHTPHSWKIDQTNKSSTVTS